MREALEDCMDLREFCDHSAFWSFGTGRIDRLNYSGNVIIGGMRDIKILIRRARIKSALKY
jgi:hypothetical protein